MKKLKSEFYDNFNGISKDIVNAGIIASKIAKDVEKYFSEDSTIRPQKRTVTRFVDSVIDAIKNGDIYKKSIFSYFNYPKKRVLMAIYKLTDDSIKVLFDFSSLYEDELVEDLREKYDSNFHFKYLLKRIENILEGKVTFISFYSLFPEYSKEEILMCLELIDDYKKYLIFRKYGENLDGDGVFITPEENQEIRTIIRKIKRDLEKLRNGYQILGLNDVYPNLSLIEIKGYIDLLTKNQKDYFYKTFGEKLDKKYIVSSPKNLIKLKFKKALDRVINYKGKKLKPFFEIFESFRMDDESLEDFKKRVINAVNTLIPENIIITQHIYGENYDNLYLLANVTSKEMRHFFHNITPSIKKRLGRNENLNVEYKRGSYERKIKTFLERFPNNDLFLKFVLYEFSLLNDKEKSLLVKMFGVNLDEVHDVSKEEKIQVYKIINNFRQKVYRKISVYLGVSLVKLYRIISLYYNSIIKEIFNDMDLNVVVAVLSYLYIENISEIDIEKVLEVNPIEHLESVKALLEEKGVNIKTLNI